MKKMMILLGFSFIVSVGASSSILKINYPSMWSCIGASTPIQVELEVRSVMSPIYGHQEAHDDDGVIAHIYTDYIGP